jgi:cbb3-type cytochrome oxidase cytochrome c subunit
MLIKRLFAGTAVVFFLASVWAAWQDTQREWKPYQRSYYELLLERTDDDRVREAIQREKIEIKQIVLPQFSRIDRCVTCHLGYDNEAMAGQPVPLGTHPDIIKNHPAEKFGCTICHDGQGAATTYEGAAHESLQFWEHPMKKGVYLQSSCGKCHKGGAVPGAPILETARILYQEEFACEFCHRIEGEGEDVGPDLTYAGSKPLHSFDFTPVQGEKTIQQWYFEHFKDPAAFVPDSLMSDLSFTDSQARALTVYMLSLTDERIPPEYLARLAGGEEAAVSESLEGRQIFEEKGCLLCHALRGRGGQLGPDLTHVATRRNADWLFLHFKEPRRMVPGTTMPDFNLNDAEANELTRFILSLR